MTKRLLAIFVAVMMLLSAFVFVGCNNEDEAAGESSAVESVESGEEESTLTLREIFESSLSNFINTTDEVPEITNATGETKMNLKVDKFTVSQMDLTQLGEISLSLDGKTDADGNVNASVELSAFGETIPFESTLYDGSMYVVDLFGLNDKAIKVEMPEINQDVEGAISGASDALANAEKYQAVVEHIITSLETVIDANIDESVFTSETKTVSVLGTEYADATVITMTIEKEKLDKIANELIDELLKNEDVKAMFGEDFDKTEALEGLEDVTAMRVVNTVVDEKSIALTTYLDVSIAIEADLDNTATAAEESAENSDNIEGEVVKEDKTFAISIEMVDKNFVLNMGFANAEGKVDATIDSAIVFESMDDGSKYSMCFKMVDTDGSEEKLFSANADITDGKYVGTFELVDTLELDFFAKLGETEGEFGITKFKIATSDETTEEIPLEISFNYTIEESKISANGKIKLNIEKTADIEVSYDMSTEEKDVTVEDVTDSIPEEEVDEEKLANDFAEKYPTIFSFFSALSGGMSGDASEDL